MNNTTVLLRETIKERHNLHFIHDKLEIKITQIIARFCKPNKLKKNPYRIHIEIYALKSQGRRGANDVFHV